MRGKTTYYLSTKKPGEEEYQINKQIKGELLRALGKPRRESLEKEINRLTEGIQTNKEEASSNRDETEKIRPVKGHKGK